MKAWTPKEIAALKKRYSLSQKELADLLGVTRIHIYYLEKGVRESSRTLRLLLDCVEEKLKGTKTKKERRKR